MRIPSETYRFCMCLVRTLTLVLLADAENAVVLKNASPGLTLIRRYRRGSVRGETASCGSIDGTGRPLEGRHSQQESERALPRSSVG